MNDTYSSHLQSLERKLSSSINNSSVAQDKGEEVSYPDTKLANAYLKKKSADAKVEESHEAFEAAFTEHMRWLLVHMTAKTAAFNDDIPPRAVSSAALLKSFQENPPNKAFRPSLFGVSSWNEVVELLDCSSKGYVTNTDMNRFWGESFHSSSGYLCFG